MRDVSEPLEAVESDEETVLRVTWPHQQADYQAVYVGGGDDHIWIVDRAGESHAVKRNRARNALQTRWPDYELIALEDSQFTA